MTADDRRRLAAREDIRDLLVRVALAQDARDWDALADCFEPDAVYQHPRGELRGVEAIVDRSRTALTPLDASQHLLGTIIVTVEDQATAISYFQAQHVRHGTPGGDLYVIAGAYRDRLACSDGRWRVSHRTQEYTWRDGNPDVIRRDTTGTSAAPR